MLGQTVSNYRIVEILGEGGMGVVYKAFDTRLERHLALKFVSASKIGGEETERRFVLEARAASALNHPNIIHIYDIGQFEGSSYIAMEHVEGRTLTSILQSGPLGVGDVLRYGIQLADAMASAHAAGIIHRDLKPANIMITTRGLVKILDFGLSKLTEAAPSSLHDPSSDSTQIDPLVTGAGVILGTPAYMSPEQARGAELDPRADIFALGLILFEMATGRTGFQGATKIEVLASILHEDLPPPSSLNAGLLPEFDWVVGHCLRKDRDHRFQSMAEVKAALEDLQGSTQRGHSSQSVTRSASWTHTGLSPRPSRRPWLWILVPVLLAAAAGAWFALRSSQPAASKLELVKLTPEAGLNSDPAVSADGKLLAYASDRAGEGNLDIWLRQIGGADPIRLTNDPADESEPDFSPDGTRVAYRSERDGGGIYVVSTLGGESRRIADRGRRPRFSPDGTRLTYWTGHPSSSGRRHGDGQVWVVDLAGGRTTQLAADFAAALFPVWVGPDRLLFVGSQPPDAFATWDWYVASISGGRPVRCNVLRFGGANEFRLPYAWRNGEVIYATAGTAESHVSALPLSPRDWQPRGDSRRLTFGTAREEHPGVSADGTRLVFASLAQNFDVYTLPWNQGSRTAAVLRRLTRDTSMEAVRAVSPDGGKLAFISDRTGYHEIYILDIATGQSRLVDPPGFSKVAPVFHPSGAQIAFTDHRGDAKVIYVAPTDGGTARRVCDSCGQPSAWSQDGRYLIYSLYDENSEISLFDLQTGRSSTYLRHPAASLFPRALSSDGRWLSFILDPGAEPGQIFVAPFEPLKPPPQSEWVAITRGPSLNSYPQWSPAMDALFFVSDRDSYLCVWKQALDPRTQKPLGEPTALRHFHDPSLNVNSAVRWIVAGPQFLALTLQELTGSVWMLDLPRP